ncbi:ligand-gated channel [Pseudomonas putida]|uniref:Ligand-gated channel n=1 Tax=Pseudomonas putida TaxID=303 RepID=A0AA37R7U7_PSEPU|nr:TonB-dependent siderophore receptor [Pseudomonas putida]GLO13321.1 ligand-gated channel [Pseudomonas putida]GLO36657.1 ligand-gated channel [Pseudomonas putida]HDS0963111.1 TonB-dependent siderophore receptor [Pseudomonas putida]HDS0991572.1 TonB-dependent siderophore receptor [Pseudomonas putida]
MQSKQQRRAVQPVRHPRPSAMALAVFSSTLALQYTVLGPLLSDASQARAATVQKRYAIAAGPMELAVTRFAGEAGVALSYDTRLTAGRMSPGLEGSFSVEQGFARLLQGSPLSAVLNGDGSYSLVEAGAGQGVMLTPTAVIGQGLEPDANSYSAGSAAVGSKVATSLREVPHSVSVITRQRIEDQNLNNLTEVMSKMTGVSLQKGGISQAAMGNESNFFSRGFAVSNTTIDGGAPLTTSIAGYGSLSQLDMAQYERVEFLRGVDGLYSSTGDPGGTINLVRKRALHDSQLAFSASAGSWDNYRSEFDVTGPLVESGAIRGRLGMAYQDSKSFLDYVDTQNSLTYGSLEVDLNPATTLTLGGSYQDNDGVPYFAGLPRYSNGDDLGLPRHTAYTASWNTVREKTTQLYAKAEHAFNDDWALTTDLSYVDIDRDSAGLYFFGAVDPVSGTGPTWNNFPNKSGSVRKSVNSYLKGGFDAFDRHHDLLVGVDYTDTIGSVIQRRGLLGVPLDLGGRTPPDDQGSVAVKKQELPEIRRSAYGMTRLALTDEFKLILGGRLSDYSYQNKQVFYSNDTQSRPPTEHKRGVTTPYAGLTYDLNDQWTAYTSYAETFTPQAGFTDTSGAQIDPATSKNYEIGLKGQLFDGRVNTSFAVYRIEQQDSAVYDEEGTGPVGSEATCCYFNAGEVVSKGFDAEVSGEVAKGLQLMAGYTYSRLEAKDAEEGRSAFEGVTPKHLLKVWGTWQLPGGLEDWKVGLGAISQSATSKSGSVSTFDPGTGTWGEPSVPYKFMQAGYTIWSASLDYKIDEHWSATLNGNNLFDKKYYSTVGTSQYNNFYGDPRNFMLTIRGKY